MNTTANKAIRWHVLPCSSTGVHINAPRGTKIHSWVDLCYFNQPAGSCHRIKSHYLMIMTLAGPKVYASCCKRKSKWLNIETRALPASLFKYGFYTGGQATVIIKTSHSLHILKHYYSNNTLESHTVITLACVPNHITIVPMLTLKMPLRVQELLHSSYQKHMDHLKMHKMSSKKGTRNTDFFFSRF